ncbi:MAG: TolC family protein [Candidatus Omnitrophica bacterium]|nr:TolC family protein [Candidatus Omnitrophota bacterium]MBU4479703.1 TolC family protein [Candidatus Omnitrophota bacterium]MCG2703507.1 TolC family protein [Candidatus Omnitrophota bacterium]
MKKNNRHFYDWEFKKRFAAAIIATAAMLLGCAGDCRALDSGAQAEVVALSLDDVSRLVLKNNPDIQMAKYDAYIRRTDLKDARSIFDTMLSLQAAYLNDRRKTSSTLLGTKSTTTDYSLGLEKKLPSGTTLGISADDSRDFSNSAFSSFPTGHEASVKFSLRQPLGNNFFGMIDRGRIKITRLDIENSDFQAIVRIEQALAQAQTAYWRLVLKQEELKTARAMLEKAEQLYAVFKDKHALGLVEDAELFGVEANVAQRRSSIAALTHERTMAKNEVLLSLHEEDLNIVIVPQDALDISERALDWEENLRRALEQRRDYKQAQNDVAMKNIELRLKRNSRWPQVDLEASFLHNGLEASQAKAWENLTQEDNPQWYMGLSVQVPLENRAASSKHEKAQWEKAKALIALKKTESIIAVEINNSVDAVNNTIEKLKLQERIVSLQENKLLFEEQRFAKGRSDTDTLIRYQEDLQQAQLALSGVRFEQKKAMIDLLLAENSLLDLYWKEAL